jgi:hypothetical protein
MSVATRKLTDRSFVQTPIDVFLMNSMIKLAQLNISHWCLVLESGKKLDIQNLTRKLLYRLAKACYNKIRVINSGD